MWRPRNRAHRLSRPTSPLLRAICLQYVSNMSPISVPDRASEGKTVEVPYRGPVAATISDLLGGLRSACTYVGAATLAEMDRRTTFVRVTQQASPTPALKASASSVVPTP